MKNCLSILRIGLLAVLCISVIASCQEAAPKDVKKEVKEKKRKRRHENHIDVDMVKRTLRFVKRNIEITPEQEDKIIKITSEYDFDSLSREEFYFKRLKLRDRIYKEVLDEEQRQQIKKR